MTKNKVFKYIAIAFTSLIFVFSLYIMVFGAIAAKNNELLTFFGYSYSAVPTDSMEGTFDDSFGQGSIIITKKVKYESIKVNDIIVYRSDAKILIVHRVVNIKEDGSLVLKGDNNSSVDFEYVDASKYLAKVIRSFNFFNLGTKIPTYQLQILLASIILLIIFIIYQVFILIKAFQDQKLERLREEHEEKLRQEIKNDLNLK